MVGEHFTHQHIFNISANLTDLKLDMESKVRGRVLHFISTKPCHDTVENLFISILPFQWKLTLLPFQDSIRKKQWLTTWSIPLPANVGIHFWVRFFLLLKPWWITIRLPRARRKCQKIERLKKLSGDGKDYGKIQSTCQNSGFSKAKFKTLVRLVAAGPLNGILGLWPKHSHPLHIYEHFKW